MPENLIQDNSNGESGRTPGSAESGALENEREIEELGETPGAAETGEIGNSSVQIPKTDAAKTGNSNAQIPPSQTFDEQYRKQEGKVEP